LVNNADLIQKNSILPLIQSIAGSVFLRKISDLAGSWNMTDAEVELMKSSIDESWKKWNPED